MTSSFDPTAFVKAGRKGEVVEDEYLAAREAYRMHRALLYAAIGETLLLQKQALPASRYYRRAVLLGKDLPPTLGLARALLALGKGRPALDTLDLVVGVDERETEALSELLAHRRFARTHEACENDGHPSSRSSPLSSFSRS